MPISISRSHAGQIAYCIEKRLYTNREENGDGHRLIFDASEGRGKGAQAQSDFGPV